MKDDSMFSSLGKKASLVSQGCPSQLPQSWQAKTMIIYSLTVLEIRSLKSRSQQVHETS